MEARLKAQELPQGGAVPQKRLGRLKKILLILFLILIMAAGTGLGVYYVNTGALPFGLQRLIEKPQVELMMPAESFLVNLKDDRAMHYLKATVVLSYFESKDQALISQSTPQIRDVVIQYLRGLSRNDIMDAGNLEIIRLDLLDQINLIFGREVVHSLYFSDFLIQ
ncbi:MAG: hypothetical protein GT601_18135 [Acidaminobacter sp.]|uniref:flagellar basal body-associated FliL family protein n=1 Tax=Acidaminobacter sp. TaxID=1872102 RepID=UPI0013853965|nr:flagellar basal body-associated FliL family protein [Acidaminobacter sp.]MZQ99591.1 hypothetical protein [Acidaminobacter sp.]